MKFRERVARFMAGRYGVDQLNKDLLWLYILLMIAGLFVPGLQYVALACAVYMIHRTLSRNHTKRWNENNKYMKVRGKVTGRFSLQKRKFADRKTHRYRTCPHCKATVRLPYKKGNHTVSCPRCRQDFQVKI